MDDFPPNFASFFWKTIILDCLFIITNFFLLLVLERGDRKENEREGNINVSEKHRLVASCTHPNWGPNLQPFGLQDNAQPTDAH